MKKIFIVSVVTAAAGAGAAFVGLMASENHGESEWGERRERVEHDGHSRPGGIGGSGFLGDPAYGLYQQECGNCHLAYPPAMLPADAWQGVVDTLADHFGDNAELDAATATEIGAFLERHSAGKGSGKYSVRTNRATQGRTPRRITETDYFVGQHHEIPRKMVADNPDIQRFSRCEACHANAADGLFDEHAVRIPGHGRWDD